MKKHKGFVCFKKQKNFPPTKLYTWDFQSSLPHEIKGKTLRQFNRNRICLTLFLITSYPLQTFVTQENCEVPFSSYTFSPFHDTPLCSLLIGTMKKVALDTVPATENTAQTVTGFTGMLPGLLVRG